MDRPPETQNPHNRSHLVDGESHCVHVFSHFLHASAVLLDQTDHEAAAVLSVVRVVVLLVQTDHKLRVRPERVCGLKTKTVGIKTAVTMGCTKPSSLV